VASALGYLHNEGVLHNDVKLDNVLVIGLSHERYTSKLIDFGHAIFKFKTRDINVLQRTKRLIGTERWAPPEFTQIDSNPIVALGPLSPTSDIFSFGFLVASLAAGYDPFKGRTDGDIRDWGRNGEIVSHLPQNVTTAWWSELLQKMFQLNPLYRYQSMEEILSHLKFRLVNTRYSQ
jgi:serine/threonine protein kinase